MYELQLKKRSHTLQCQELDQLLIQLNCTNYFIVSMHHHLTSEVASSCVQALLEHKSSSPLTQP